MAFLERYFNISRIITRSGIQRAQNIFCINNKPTGAKIFDHTNIVYNREDGLIGIYAVKHTIALIYETYIVIRFDGKNTKLDYTLDKRLCPKILDYKIAPIKDGLVVLDNSINKVIVIKQDDIKYYDLPENKCLISIVRSVESSIVINYLDQNDGVVYYKVNSGKISYITNNIKKNDFCYYSYLGIYVYYILYDGEVYYVNILQSKFDKFKAIEFDRDNNLLFTDGENYYTALGYIISSKYRLALNCIDIKSARKV